MTKTVATIDRSATDKVNSFWIDLLGAETRFRTVGGYRTRSIEAGAGDAVICLHGVSGHAEAWSRNLMPLGRFGRLHALDMLGHGLTDKPMIDYSIEVLGEHVLRFADEIGAEKVHLVGQSLGGWVSGWLTVHHPDRIASFISVTGAGLQITEDGAALTAKHGANVGNATKQALDNPTREKVRARLEWLVHDPKVVTEELVETRYRLYSRPDFLAVAPRLVDAFTFNVKPTEVMTREKLASISVPTLVFWTRHNPTMQWEIGQQASQIIPNASWYLMEDAGHWPQFEKPEEFNQVIGSFLEKAARQEDVG
jgi:2-hydroxy-6-oxonona-2,4-dienedioate hydrolase